MGLSTCRQFWNFYGLVGEAVLCLGISRIALAYLPTRWIVRPSGSTFLTFRKRPVKDATSTHKIDQISCALRTANRFSPWNSSCLVKGLAGKIMCNRRGIPSTLYLGVAKHSPDQLAAHAWLEVNDDIICGQYADAQYKIIAQF